MKPVCAQCGKECSNWKDIPEGKEVPKAFCSRKCAIAYVKKE